VKSCQIMAEYLPRVFGHFFMRYIWYFADIMKTKSLLSSEVRIVFRGVDDMLYRGSGSEI